MLQPSGPPRRYALLACVSLVLVVATSASIRSAGHRWDLQLPWFLTRSVLQDLRWFPISIVALVLGIALSIAAARSRSHPMAAGAALLSTALVYCDTLEFWSVRPEFLDLRVPVTFCMAYIVQAVAVAALIAHAFIFLAPRSDNLP